MSAADVISLIKEKEAKFVDLRFTDTKGKEQHVTVPASQVDDEFLEDGKMFDGSSISGWKGINESDMILLPDPASAVVDVFSDETQLNLRCNVIEPATMQGYDRCPRSLAGRAEAYLKSTGIADAAFFGPENEFAVLKGQCFEYADNEYIYTLCPFDRCAQKPKSGHGETSLGRWEGWRPLAPPRSATGGVCHYFSAHQHMNHITPQSNPDVTS